MSKCVRVCVCVCVLQRDTGTVLRWKCEGAHSKHAPPQVSVCHLPPSSSLLLLPPPHLLLPPSSSPPPPSSSLLLTPSSRSGRSVCGYLLDLSLKRAAGWKAEEEEEAQEAPPNPTPLAFSQDTPTHSANGQEVVQPLPVESAPPASYQPPQTTLPPPPPTNPQSTPLEQTATSQQFYSHSHYPQTIPSGIQPLEQTTPHHRE